MEKFKMPEGIQEMLEKNKEKFANERNRKYNELKKANMDINAHLVSQLEDEIDKIVFVEENYKCLKCRNPENCLANNWKHQPRIELNNGEYGLVYYHCKNSRGRINSYIEIKSCNDYYGSVDKKKVVDELIRNKCGYLSGIAGRGKTYIMRYIANHFNKQGKSVYLHLASDIKRNMLNYKDRIDIETLEEIENVDVLIIDDFYNEAFTPMTIERVWTPIIKKRIDNKKGIYLISNYTYASFIKEIELVKDKTEKEVIDTRLKHLPKIDLREKNLR